MDSKPQLLENRAFLVAYRKGRAAAAARQPRVNPYPDKRNDSGRVTFSAAFRSYWFEGYDDAQAGLPERYRPLNVADAHLITYKDTPMYTDIDLTSLPTAADGQLLCPKCGEPLLLEITRHNFTPGRRGNGELDVEYEPLDDDVEEFVTDAGCRHCSWSYLDADEDAADEDPATPPANAVAPLIQALQVAWWELGMFPYPSTPDDPEQIAAEYLAQKFRVGQRLRFVGGGMNLRAVLLDPDTEVDIQGQVGTVVATNRTRTVTVCFDTYPTTPVKMYAADEEFELVDPPVPANPPVSADCQEFITWLVSQLGSEETKELQTLSPQPPTPAQAAFAAALRADTPHRRFLQALAVPPAQWTDAEWSAIRAEFATQWPQPECPFNDPTAVWTDESGIVFDFRADDATWHWQVDWETGRFWLY